MKLKHNKKRNTAFLYEVLIRNLTKAALEEDHDLKKNIINIVKEHFRAGTELKKQLNIYNSLSDADHLHPFIAEKIVFEAKKLHDSLSQKKIFKEQGEVISKINKLISKDAFNVFIPNYKSLASIYQIFDKTVPLKTRVLMEGRVIKNLIDGEEVKEKKMPPIDNLIFKSFAKRFNSKYTGELLESQKLLLNKYIVSFVDNSSDFKIYLNEEIQRLKKKIEGALSKEEILINEELTGKLNKVKNIVDNFKDVSTDQNFIEQILKIQGLVEEV